MPGDHDNDEPQDAGEVLELHLRLNPHGDWRVVHPGSGTRASGHNLRLALTCLAERTERRTPIALTQPGHVLSFEIPSARFQAIVDDVWARSCACDELAQAVTIVHEDRLQLCTEDMATLLRVTPTEVRDAFAAGRQTGD